MANTRMPRGAIPTPRNKLATAIPYTIDGTTPPNDGPASGPKAPAENHPEAPDRPEAEAGAKIKKSPPRGLGQKVRDV
jgi:hypothetical protein